jgi:hypothetical protein
MPVQKNPIKPTLRWVFWVFLGGFFWVLLGGFFLGGFFIANPAVFARKQKSDNVDE